MFSALFRFELSYQLRQFTFITFSLIFFAFGLLQGSQGYATDLVDFNAPYQIFYNIGLTSIGCEFVIMFFVVSGILRDRRHQMESIVFSTAVLKKTFFGESIFRGFYSEFAGILNEYGRLCLRDHDARIGCRKNCPF